MFKCARVIANVDVILDHIKWQILWDCCCCISKNITTIRLYVRPIDGLRKSNINVILWIIQKNNVISIIWCDFHCAINLRWKVFFCWKYFCSTFFCSKKTFQLFSRWILPRERKNCSESNEYKKTQVESVM